MQHKCLAWVVFAAAFLSAYGCKEVTSSQNIRTGGIAALVTVESSNGADSTVTVELRVGGDESNTYVDLDGGDRLFVEAGGERKEMSSRSAGVYTANFNTAAADTAFQVFLERTEDESASSNTGTLPAPFEITNAPSSAPVSRSEDTIELVWEPSSSTDDMRIETSDEGCIFSYDKSIGGDPGTLTIEAGQLQSTNSDEPETCDVTVTLTRQRRGSADLAFDEESYFILRQVRSYTFVSAP